MDTLSFPEARGEAVFVREEGDNPMGVAEKFKEMKTRF